MITRVTILGKKFNVDEMQAAIQQNWGFFQQKMQTEWAEFKTEELAEAKENLHSFIVQVERRTHESSQFVKDKLMQWRTEAPSAGRR